MSWFWCYMAYFDIITSRTSFNITIGKRCIWRCNIKFINLEKSFIVLNKNIGNTQKCILYLYLYISISSLTYTTIIYIVIGTIKENCILINYLALKSWASIIINFLAISVSTHHDVLTLHMNFLDCVLSLNSCSNDVNEPPIRSLSFVPECFCNLVRMNNHSVLLIFSIFSY